MNSNTIILSKDWEFGSLGIYNYHKPGKLSPLLSFLQENDQDIDGDIIESGVFRGAQTLAIAMFLKEIGSNKKIYAFDSFNGFPPIYSKYDDVNYFHNMYDDKLIEDKQYHDICLNIKYKNSILKSSLDAHAISNSKDFSKNNLCDLRNKIDYFKLDNIIIVDGTFENTMVAGAKPEKIMAGIIDCDLYESYKVTLEYISTRLCKNGLLYLDEYYSIKYPGGRVAVDEFLKNNHNFILEKHKISDGEFDRYYLKAI